MNEILIIIINRSVFLARKKATGDVFAIKLLKKSEMRTKNQKDHVRNERNVLAFADNPFVVKMYYSFQSEVLFSFFIIINNVNIISIKSFNLTN